MLTKEVLKDALLRGESLENILGLTEGQNCTIFKTYKFFPTDILLYIPNLELNSIPYRSHNLPENIINHIIDCCYSGKDFIAITKGDETKAKRLFHYVDWQHPSSAHPSSVYYAGEIDDEEETEEIIDNQTIGLVYTISHCSYTGTSVSYPVAIVTDLSKAEEIKKSIVNKYGDCETYYFHINALEPVTEEEIKKLEELKEMRGEFNVEH